MNHETDQQIINLLSKELPLCSRPFQAMAEMLDISEGEVIERISRMKEDGRLRRVGAAFRHMQLGYVCNVMVVWDINLEKIKEAKELMTSFKAVSHCYERKAATDWQYNLYTMIHGKSKEEVMGIIDQMVSFGKHNKYKMLFTVKELKKTGVSYFPASKIPLR